MASEVRLDSRSVEFTIVAGAFGGARKLNSFIRACGFFSSVIKKDLQSERLKALRIGRDAEIRTRDLTHPKGARYQAAPRPVRRLVSREKSFCQMQHAR